ncbi:MAG: ATP-dependent DNA helicase RecG, partial [Spirochaetes bacterium]|nr:ATP-dependent DNA helicase RecG [Spirochaetota bacterium]
ELVSDFAERLAHALGIHYLDGLRKTRSTEPQKVMQNSYQQAHNIADAFAVTDEARTLLRDHVVLLVDDIVDSRWTITIIGMLLRDVGAHAVYPFALASSAPR